MLSIGIGEIQKNSSIFSNLNEVIQIVDKRKKQILAMVYPVNRHSMVSSLAGKYKNRVSKNELNIDEIKEFSMSKAMEEKYGLSS
ncbi:MAG: hypothetical protein GQ570_09565 [Helicobacteraceae bacterium]|nr:hypothetical protein [Helicobacteraceae bacterium]